MNCPRCGSLAKVIGKKDEPHQCGRRRRCVNKDCDYRFRTKEVFIHDNDRAGNFTIGIDEVRELIALAETKLYTQKQLGERFGISQQQVSRILLGKRWSYATKPPLPRKRSRA